VVAILYVPFLQEAFGTHALALGEWLMVAGAGAGAGATVVPVLEIVKLLVRARGADIPPERRGG